MRSILKYVIVSSLITCGFSYKSLATEYKVFYGYEGTVTHYKNPSAVAITYEYDGPRPLIAALVKFFNGPTPFEMENTGSIQVFDCASRVFEVGPTYKCGADDVFKSVRVENGIAHIELLGVPSAPTSGQWTAFRIPFEMTVTQFHDVMGYQLYVAGQQIKGLDWGLGCDDLLCFRIPATAEDLHSLLKGQN